MTNRICRIYCNFVEINGLRDLISGLRSSAFGRSRVGVALFAALLLTSGCETLLQADFESFADNETPPFGSLPGPPVGDSFQLSFAGDAVVLEDSLNPNKRIRLNSSTLGALQFLPKPLETQQNNYFVSFEGNLNAIPDSGAAFGISFFGETDQGQSAIACNLSMLTPFLIQPPGEIGKVAVDLKSSAEEIGTLLLGYFHQVVVRINVPNKRCYFSIQQSGKIVSDVDVPFSTPDFAKLTSLQFIISNQNDDGQVSYYVDDVEVTTN